MLKTKPLGYLLVAFFASVFLAHIECTAFGQTLSATIRSYQSSRDDLLDDLQESFLRGVSSQKIFPKFEKHQRSIAAAIEAVKDASSPSSQDIEYLQAEQDVWGDLEKNFLQLKSAAEQISEYKSQIKLEIDSAFKASQRWKDFFSGMESFLGKVDDYRARYQKMAVPINGIISFTAEAVGAMSGPELRRTLHYIAKYEELLKDVKYRDLAQYYIARRASISNLFVYDLVEQYETLEKETQEFNRLYGSLTRNGKAAIAIKLTDLTKADSADRGIYTKFETAIDRFLQSELNETSEARDQWQDAVSDYEDATRDNYPSISKWFKARFKDSKQTIMRLRLWYAVEMTEIPDKVNAVEEIVVERLEELGED